MIRYTRWFADRHKLQTTDEILRVIYRLLMITKALNELGVLEQIRGLF